MDEWSGVRTALVIVAWLTVAGGALMAVLWIAFGGERAIGPEDEMMARAGVRVDDEGRPRTSFSSAQVGMHGFLGILTAGLITYAAVRVDDRGAGYWAGLVSIAVTAIPGTLMFLKWRGQRRPDIGATTDLAGNSRVEAGVGAATPAAPLEAGAGAAAGARSVRPRPGSGGAARGRRVEDRLPSAVVLLHGIAALTTAALLVALLLLD